MSWSSHPTLGQMAREVVLRVAESAQQLVPWLEQKFEDLMYGPVVKVYDGHLVELAITGVEPERTRIEELLCDLIVRSGGAWDSSKEVLEEPPQRLPDCTLVVRVNLDQEGVDVSIPVGAILGMVPPLFGALPTVEITVRKITVLACRTQGGVSTPDCEIGWVVYSDRSDYEARRVARKLLEVLIHGQIIQ